MLCGATCARCLLHVASCALYAASGAFACCKLHRVCVCVCVACCKLRRVCVLHAARGAGFACGVHDEERVHHVPLRTHRPPLGSSAPTPRGRRPKAALGIGKRRASCLSDRMSWGQRGLEDRSDSHKQTSRRCFRGAALRDCRRGAVRSCARVRSSVLVFVRMRGKIRSGRPPHFDLVQVQMLGRTRREYRNEDCPHHRQAAAARTRRE